MKRASLALCAVGGFVMLVAGCKSLDLGFDFLSAGVDAAGDVRVMDGSPDMAALSLQATLKQRGFDSTINKTADTVVVQSKTTSGLRFALMLTSQRAANGREQTKMKLEWLDSRDQQVGALIFADLDRQTAAKK